MKHFYIFFTIIFTLNITLNVKAENKIFYIGAGGVEKNKPETIFHESLKSANPQLYDRKNWEATVLYNGGHSEDEKTRSLKFSSLQQKGKTVTNFTQEEWQKLILKLEKDLKENKVKKGEKIFVFINSHGLPLITSNDPSKDEGTHSIVTSDHKNVSLDPLYNVLLQYAEKGVQVGVVDNSCYSGNSQIAGKNSENMCVISSTSDINFGYTDFPYFITRELKTGVDLESAFLNARKKSIYSPTLPQINTPEGQTLQDLLKNFNQYLMTNDRDPLTPNYQQLDIFLKNIQQQIYTNPHQCQQILEKEILPHDILMLAKKSIEKLSHNPRGKISSKTNELSFRGEDLIELKTLLEKKINS